MYKNLIIASIFGASAVILGAFGAHSLKNSLTPEALQSFETAVRYQLIHAIVLLFINSFEGFSNRQKQLLTLTFTTGILFFSGSIYSIYLVKIPAKSIWFITPLGGILFILGWLLMIFFFLKKINNESK